MKFGVFDHMDGRGLPLAAQFEARLRVIEARDRCGVHGYHVAEHRATPLGCATLRSVCLATVAPRTRRIRIVNPVYTLPLAHRPKLVDEIGMLGALTNRPMMPGMGRGISPIEASIGSVEGFAGHVMLAFA